ncbi:hypothetical protein Poli38472_010101 [Pythium oligandrum]|uniref:Uncharacterized protein n=1 Tax=Pythium oligandrum TaxID=41045 RepID=A0A8K1C9S3_PYTOL|nr:hypothetical protein Poli38472_010101 [Pythium oligandrum]|eukprot:TMW58542.1 hypothetical protein Poli38472_010101 [Pythium oligandrum]
METMEELDTIPIAVSSVAGAPGTHKSSTQLLHELLAIAYHVFEEAKHMNLKPPLQPSSRLFSLDGINSSGAPSPPRSPVAPDSPSDDSMEMNGSGSGHGGHGGHHAVMQPVIPFSPEEIQDSYTRMATLKSQYTKISTELLELIKQTETRRSSPDATKGPNAEEKESVEKLKERRNQLRREVYERNLVMKGLIDRLRHLQYSIQLVRGVISSYCMYESIEKLKERRNQLRREVYERNLVMKGLIDHLRHLQYSIQLVRGGSTEPPQIVMESVYTVLSLSLKSIESFYTCSIAV